MPFISNLPILKSHAFLFCSFDFHDLVDVEVFVKAAPKLLSVDYKEICNIETLSRLMAKLSGWLGTE